MVGYIIKYQNSYVYADLFYHNLLEQIDKGVEVKRLFKSKIFYYQLDFAEWPDFHLNDEETLQPCNKSVLHLRMQYDNIYPKYTRPAYDKSLKKSKTLTMNKKRKSFSDMKASMAKNLSEQAKKFGNDNQKPVKINYFINLLSSLQEDDGLTLMGVLANCD